MCELEDNVQHYFKFLGPMNVVGTNLLSFNSKDHFLYIWEGLSDSDEFEIHFGLTPSIRFYTKLDTPEDWEELVKKTKLALMKKLITE